MSASFLSAVADRAAGAQLAKVLQHVLDRASPAQELLAWRLDYSSVSGRRLVAARTLPAGTLVFEERPLAVGTASGWKEPGQGAQAVAAELLLGEPAAGAAELQSHYSRNSKFQEAVSAFTEKLTEDCVRNGVPVPTSERIAWSIGVATINVHGSSDPPIRGVLGLLASMPEHSCTPNCTMNVGPHTEGSMLKLHTLRAVQPGEPLSISYTVSYAPTSERRRRLLAGHAFLCKCTRCESAPEYVRAFQCVRGDCDGAASPLHSGSDCRTLICDDCSEAGRGVLELDDSTWSRLMAAERAEDFSQCVPVLHPYHHKMIEIYKNNMTQVPAESRPELFCQFADAHVRLSDDDYDELAAGELMRAALAFHAIGDTESALEKLGAAASSFGANCDAIGRCRRAQRALEKSEAMSSRDLLAIINPSWLR